jgi:hypothetical protein
MRGVPDGTLRSCALKRSYGRSDALVKLAALRRAISAALAGSIILAGVPIYANAQESFEQSLLSAKESDFWVNFGAFSQHFNNASKFNQTNAGFGLEYQLDDDRALVIGQYRNSVRDTTRYLGGAWMPLEIGIVKFGAIAGMADGYPEMRGGGFFPIILPLMVVETRHVGINFTIMPNVATKVNGCLAMQLKFRY